MVDIFKANNEYMNLAAKNTYNFKTKLNCIKVLKINIVIAKITYSKQLLNRFIFLQSLYSSIVI